MPGIVALHQIRAVKQNVSLHERQCSLRVRNPCHAERCGRTPALQDSTEAAGTRSCCDLRAKKKEPQVHQSAVVRIVDFAKLHESYKGCMLQRNLPK